MVIRIEENTRKMGLARWRGKLPKAHRNRRDPRVSQCYCRRRMSMVTPFHPKRIVCPGRHLLGVLLGFALCLPAAAQDDIRLPDLGSSADALISDQDAQSYGAAMVRQMRALNLVVEDPQLEDYINDLGHRLSSSSDKPKQHYSFFIVKDPQINAFAAPGGYIAVNSGLITITQSQAELASVIAHEIGHITQNHLQRAFEASKKDAPLMALVLLGAIAAGAGSSGDAASAILLGGQGALAQKQINFTRKDETEADRVGIQTLAKAGFNPEAMAEFFGRMADTMRTGSAGDVPSLLQDHPVTTTRISDAKARAGALEARQKEQPRGSTLNAAQWSRMTAPIAYVRDPIGLLSPKVSIGDRVDTYDLMRERVRVLAGDAGQLSTYYAANLKNNRGFDTPANRYGYALALTRSGRSHLAVAQLQALLKDFSSSMPLRLALADAQFQDNQQGAALALYARLNAESPRDAAVTLPYAKALIALKDKSQGLKAAGLLRPQLETSEDPDLYRTYAQATALAGQDARSGEAYADVSYLSGRPFDALEQLKRLLRRDDLDYYARSRIQARIADLTPLVLELRKRKIDTPDNPDRDRRTGPQNG